MKLFYFNNQMPTNVFLMQPIILHIYHILFLGQIMHCFILTINLGPTYLTKLTFKNMMRPRKSKIDKQKFLFLFKGSHL